MTSFSEISPAIWSLIAVIMSALIIGSVTLVGHYVIRSNAKLQADITQEANLIIQRTSAQGHYISSENTKLQVKLAANMKLAEFRQNWINSLRDDMAKFQAIGVTPDKKHINEQEFYRLGTRIELFMNPLDPDYSELENSLYEFFEAKTIEEKYSANPRYVEVCQRILKREWDVLKEEIKMIAD